MKVRPLHEQVLHIYLQDMITLYSYLCMGVRREDEGPVAVLSILGILSEFGTFPFVHFVCFIFDMFPTFTTEHN